MEYKYIRSKDRTILKIILPIFFILLSSSFSFAFPVQIGVKSRIKEVTIFSNQALVKREGIAEVKEGLNEVFFKLEAFRIDENSISAKVMGEGEILSVQLRDIFYKEPPQKKIKDLQEKIEQLRESKEVFQDNIEILNKKEQFLLSITNFSQTQTSIDIKTNYPKIEELEKTLTFLSSNFQNINEETRGIKAKIKEIEKELQVLERELVTIKKSSEQKVKRVEILFKAEKEQKIKIELTYLVFDAYWDPLYRIAVSSDMKDMDLVMFSSIRQKTGEDWQGVALRDGSLNCDFR